MIIIGLHRIVKAESSRAVNRNAPKERENVAHA